MSSSSSSPNVTSPPLSSPPSSVIVHPLVLLSVTDHYNRVARDTRKRVVGVLLGTMHKGAVDVVNSFAVPFEEDLKNPDVWFLDHNYLENMFAMFRKVTAKERIVGFYSSHPTIKPNDLKINSLLGRFCANPVFVTVDVRPNQSELPTNAYLAVDNLEEGEIKKSFKHLPSTVGAMEAEEVGVEHLLRDINDPTVSTVAGTVKQKTSSLASLASKLTGIRDYLLSNPNPNPAIIDSLQELFNLLPNLDNLHSALTLKTNDMHVSLYVASLVRAVLGLHDLVVNRVREGDEGEAGEEKKDDKAKAKEDKEEGKAKPA
mmetsp:Transcript_20787/g.43362  ORF Transcript_20787/g.43362 Transcript_20787/m.43362 type:complete len:316 (+) Transcript_20787:156-1103(+)